MKNTFFVGMIRLDGRMIKSMNKLDFHVAALRDAQLAKTLRHPEATLELAINRLNTANLRLIEEVLALIRAGMVPEPAAMQAAETLAENNRRIGEAAAAYGRYSMAKRSYSGD